jgi:hypothetical protein
VKDKDSKEEKYLFATISSLTGRGGHVATAPEALAFQGLDIASAGDIGTYRDRNEVVFTDGAGLALVIGDRSAELFGGSPSNGDRITQMLRGDDGLLVCDGERIPRLFDPARMLPQHTDADRGHNHA